MTRFDDLTASAVEPGPVDSASAPEADNSTTTGPLTGLRVIELGGIGPAPHAGLMLADLGADVVRVEAHSATRTRPRDHLLRRSKRVVQADLKDPDERGLVLELVDAADVLLEGFRPGVAARLGLGPDQCRERNPRLVYAHLTGWGQTGPLAMRAGHDINYISVTGALHAIGRADERPVPPLNLVGDYGGGSMMAVVGILAAVVERATSGRGQVVDVAMVDGVAMLTQHMWSLRGGGLWRDDRGTNMLTGAAPYYNTYACADGGYVAVGAIEPQFYAQLIEGIGLADAELPDQNDESAWPVMRARFAGIFASRSRDDWAETFAGTDACVTPVLSFGEAARYPHLVERGTLRTIGAETQANPAPRFSRSRAGEPVPPGDPTPLRDVVTTWRSDPAQDYRLNS